MLVLKRTIGNPLQLRAWFPSDLQLGSIFIPELLDVPVGQELCLWLVLQDLHVDLYFVGTIGFRRLKANKGVHGLSKGSGLVLRPGHVSELGFLQRLLTDGPGEIAARRFARTPILAPWEAKVVVPHLRMWSPATVSEISLGGARVKLDLMPLHKGAVLQLELPGHSKAVHELELAWFQAGQQKVLAGLSRSPENNTTAADWEELVARAMEYFRGRVRET
ncbi:MAG: PilZ domain-containing protein [Polyangia bacterium]|jgi:hypothetical protein|nr:PilZ domain-containing protein [Polyangia bacterium]